MHHSSRTLHRENNPGNLELGRGQSVNALLNLEETDQLKVKAICKFFYYNCKWESILNLPGITAIPGSPHFFVFGEA